ncbi:uncharacterized protein LOC123880703 isoform X2 [Maniola jurtina]|uniref:uncharacterized protein LOC123880703 isoform X2 n=1 Tax=Maniola jurtina TaxID=191418 RepID=UPI001E6867CB|nr:uncharacterized protein LOC123880703 isoform X2 [Maniola jurtina]
MNHNFYKMLELEAREFGSCYPPLCMDMCPKEEITARTAQGQVHLLEVTPKGKKMVKCHAWTVACPTDQPRQLRPFRILYETLHHLLLEVPKRLDTDFNLQMWDSSIVPHRRKLPIMYDFLDDRLTAMRHDMMKQRIPTENLCTRPRDEFDLEQNKKVFTDCLQWCLNCCDVQYKKDTGHMEPAIKKHNSKQELKFDVQLIESLNIIFNLGDNAPLHRYMRLPEFVRKSTPVKLAYDIAMANIMGNFVRVIELGKKLCPLTFYALIWQLPKIQRRGLKDLSHGFSQHEAISGLKVQDWLYFGNYEDVKRTCAFYGLQLYQKCGVIFNEKRFNEDVQDAPFYYFPTQIDTLPVKMVLTYQASFKGYDKVEYEWIRYSDVYSIIE